VRLAYERGRAEMEHSLVDGLRKSAAKGYAPAAMFLLKTQFGYRENDPVIPQQQNAIIITLPDSLSPEQWQERQRQRAALAAPIIDVEHKVITNGGTDAE
jgi:hypothetical protein